AHAELGMEAVFNPDHGTLEISAALSRNSYLLSRHCRLTGGYAFYLWFAKEHEGEFVVTLGGYHPSFKKPAYYPKEPRLGFNWPVSHRINIKGGGYFALTPSCVMAGCTFNAVYHVRHLRAWFTAHVNFLIDWKPFYYDVAIGISVGVSYTVRKWHLHHTFKIELGASLHVWGPEFVGKARIHWHVISFSISFGNSSNPHQLKLKWHDFSDSFLPNDQEPQRTKLMLTASKPRKKVCSIRVSKGLLKKVGEPEYWIINPGKLSLITHTVIPSTEMKLNDTDLDLKDLTTEMGIRPMGVKKLVSEHTIIIEKQNDDKTWQLVPKGYFHSKVVSGTVPSAIWSKDELRGPSADVIKNAAVGLEIQTTEITSHEVLSDSKVLEYEGINLEFSWGDVKFSKNPNYPEDPMKELKDTIMSDSLIQKRKNILAAVGSAVDVDVKELAESLQAPPSLFNLGA
ncbi:MAG: hypothetical protein KAR13_17025, partial [Desulfobulbaceae bacterium]|nr:hypothetical protein [Desulfobulbaceae bacterium]